MRRNEKQVSKQGLLSQSCKTRCSSQHSALSAVCAVCPAAAVLLFCVVAALAGSSVTALAAPAATEAAAPTARDCKCPAAALAAAAPGPTDT